MTSAQDPPIEYELIRDSMLLVFDVVETKIEPTVGNEDYHVRIVLKIEDEPHETWAFALIFTLGALSFHDGRPRGVSDAFFEDEDEWRASDFLRHLRFERGELHFFADYVRGRCMKTTVDVSKDGTVVLDTVNRGQAATRWVERLKGKKLLRAI